MIPGIAGAGELNLGGEAKLGYDSNVFNRGDVKVDSGQLRLSAWGSVEDELERGSYRLRYSPTYFVNEDSRADNQWNHRASLGGVFRFSPRTSLQVYDEFVYVEKNVFLPDDLAAGSDIDDSNQKTVLNSVGLRGSHQLTRRLSAYAAADFTVYRFNRSQDQDSDRYSGYAGLNYALGPKLTVGGGGQASYWIFDAENNDNPASNPIPPCANENGPKARTLSYSGFLSASYLASEHTSIEVQGGPARIETQNWFCGQTPLPIFLKQESEQFTWFAQAELLHRFSQFLSTSLRYRRSEGLGGVGSTTVNDTLIARASWKPIRYWNLELRGSWIGRQAVGVRSPVDRLKEESDTNTWTIAATVTRQILRRLRVGLDLSYRSQSEDRSFSNPDNVAVPVDQGIRDFDAYRIFGTVSYEFDPIRY